MQFFNLENQQTKLKKLIQKGIDNVLAHGQYILGPEVSKLENELCHFTNSENCITCANGTDALQIALMAINIKSGDEVIVPAFTYISPAEAVAILGAKPIYVDIDENTYNIDVNKIEERITNKTKAIIAVSLYGQCANFTEINKIAKKHNLVVIEDAAQSFGASHFNKKSCNLTDIATTSFFPTKPLGCYGDGGAIFTNDEDLAYKMKQISRHGQSKRYHHQVVGMNSRLDSIQAAILLAKLSLLEEEVEIRDKVASRYINLMEHLDLKSIPYIEDGNQSVWAQYTIEVENRNLMQEELKKNNIPTAVHYPIPLNKQPAVSSSKLNFPNAEDASEHVLSLPMSAYLTEKEQDKVVDTISSILNNK